MTTSTTVNDNNTSVNENITTTTTDATVNINNSGGNDTVTTDDSGATTVNANNTTGNDDIDIANVGSATDTVNLNNSTGNDDVLIAGTTVNATVNDNNSGVTGGADIVDIDGVRVKTADGWWLIRASNTQAVIVARAESRTEDGLARLKRAIEAELSASGMSVRLA